MKLIIKLYVRLLVGRRQHVSRMGSQSGNTIEDTCFINIVG